MNERFFDLNKSKQDRIINSALSVFTENGFAHASTDEIVGRAGISKGLLFHYFGSKLGTYAFLYEYSTRYVLLAVKNEFRGRETDFFSLHRRLAAMEAEILRVYPCMLLFLQSADLERDPKVTEALLTLHGKTRVAYQGLYEQTKVPQGYRKEDVDQLNLMLAFCKNGLMRGYMHFGKIPETQYKDSVYAFLTTLDRRETKEQPQAKHH